MDWAALVAVPERVVARLVGLDVSVLEALASRQRGRMIAGIDFSTRAVDVVLLDEDSDAATWHRFELEGANAFDRVRSVRSRVPVPSAAFWDDVLAVGIEDPRGYGAGSLYRIQGAVVSCIPHTKLVHPLIPSSWRKTVGLPGNASKDAIREHVWQQSSGLFTGLTMWDGPPQDACDAYCIALATRSLLQHGERAA
jgi:hypothetical protein